LQPALPAAIPLCSKRAASVSHQSVFIVAIDALALRSLVLQVSSHLTKLLRSREIKSLARSEPATSCYFLHEFWQPHKCRTLRPTTSSSGELTPLHETGYRFDFCRWHRQPVSSSWHASARQRPDRKKPGNMTGAEFFLPSTTDAAQGRIAAERASTQTRIT
jgi:hypothetical protein